MRDESLANDAQTYITDLPVHIEVRGPTVLLLHLLHLLLHLLHPKDADGSAVPRLGVVAVAKHTHPPAPLTLADKAGGNNEAPAAAVQMDVPLQSKAILRRDRQVQDSHAG